MKQFAILIAALCTIGMTAGESQAQHHHGHHHTYRAPRSSGFSFSIGNGYSGFSYSNLRPGYGYGRPIYRPPVYQYRGYGGYGGGFYGGYGRGHYGGRGYGCGW